VQLIARQQYETERVQVELEKVRDELIRKTRLATIGQVSASIAHELRNPLGTVRNAAYYLKRHAPGRDPKLAEYLSIIEQETSTADAIISNLTEMTRLREPAKQAVDFGRMVQEVFDRAELPQEIGWRLSLEPEPFVLHADAGQLRQVVGNLVTNAVQALEERGQILVVASRSADYDTITFKDSGPGVAPAVRERLFEPLVTTRAKGTGLGLTICRQIIQQHGGTIELADQEGRGAAFRIRLPC
jgi:signal transduction histidine kinase